ncbi:MAG: selenocysteine-specific translation elongation factor [Synergistota bacterium]|nr:selenocysteine-specific translation elongation factor [Synergistota bacterium]
MSERSEIPVVLGTAGHIDHGKTTLIRSLTGVDCDRLRAEKQRGITIELGFAPLELPDGRVVSVVDVPGHERFIRQMVAGAAGIDGVILVVAADEGVRAQTREHLDILSLLGVRDGIIVVTKKDIVDPELLELAKEEIREEIAGGFLDGCPMVAVSAAKGDGLNEVMEAIRDLVARVEKKTTEGAFFLPIDRAFLVRGFGAVVTGTAYRGKVKVDDPLSVLPGERETSVRSLQVHDTPVQKAMAGQRVALALGGLSLDELERGDVLCEKNVFRESRFLDVRISLLASSPEPLKHWQRVRLHVGTSDVLARIAFLDREALAPGETCLAQLVAEEKIVCTIREPFVIRFYSPLRTIGGGKVLLPGSDRARGSAGRRRRLDILSRLEEAQNSLDRMLVHMQGPGFASVPDVSQKVQENQATIRNLARKLASAGKVRYFARGEGWVFHCEWLKAIGSQAQKVLDGFHESEPEQKGMLLEVFTKAVTPSIESDASRNVIEALQEAGYVEQEGKRIKRPGFSRAEYGEVNRAQEMLLEHCRSRGMEMSTVAEAASELQLPETTLQKALDVLKSEGRLFLAAGGMMIDKSTLDETVSKMRAMEGDITVASVRDATGTSRKYALPFLELLDKLEITRRVQNKRIFRKT